MTNLRRCTLQCPAKAPGWPQRPASPGIATETHTLYFFPDFLFGVWNALFFRRWVASTSMAKRQ